MLAQGASHNVSGRAKPSGFDINASGRAQALRFDIGNGETLFT